MLAHYVVEPEQRTTWTTLPRHSSTTCTIHIEELIGTGRNQKNMRDLPPADICDYACEDADVTLRLYPILREKMAECDVTSVFSRIEMPLLPVLARMEQNGVRLDTQALRQTGDDFRARLHALEEEVYTLAGHEFTITSPKQVGTVLFEGTQNLGTRHAKPRRDNIPPPKRCSNPCATSTPSSRKSWHTVP